MQLRAIIRSLEEDDCGMSPKLEEVFGVSSTPVRSYVQRSSVDGRFLEAVKADKQIVVYGSSKQGKTSLVQEHLPYEKNIVVRLTPKTSISDIYQSILRQLQIRLRTENTESTGREFATSVKTSFKALIPIFGGGEAGAEGGVKSEATREQKYEEIPFNLELPQDVSELIKRRGV